MGEAIVFTSGKGGVGKTTSLANLGIGLSQLDKKVVMLDTDIGLRNLDIVMGVEHRICYHLFDVLENKCRLKQALIHDKRYPNLYILPAALKQRCLLEYEEAFRTLIHELKKEFDFCLIDCPAGIAEGFHFALSGADSCVVVTTPQLSAIQDAYRVVSVMQEEYREMPIAFLLNSVDEAMMRKRQMISTEEIKKLLGVPLIGTISYSKKMLVCQNVGIPAVTQVKLLRKQYMEIARYFLVPTVASLDDEVQEVNYHYA